MELISSAEDDLNKLGNINIGAGNTIIQKYLMTYINEFHNKYPNIDVKVHDATALDESMIEKADIVNKFNL